MGDRVTGYQSFGGRDSSIIPEDIAARAVQAAEAARLQEIAEEEQQALARRPKGIPAVFFWLQPCGQANLFFQAVLISLLLLKTLDLAQNHPNEVLLLPWLLQHTSAENIAGVSLGVHKLFTGIFGQVAGMMADICGLKTITSAMGVVVMLGGVLMTSHWLYFPGLLIATLGTGAMQTTWMALFSSQFQDKKQSQDMVSYAYALQNIMWFCGTTLAGLQSFRLLCAESAGIMGVGLLCFWFSPVKFAVQASGSNAPEEEEAPGAPAPGNASSERARLCAFALLMAFSLLFLSLFPQFLGGPFLLFCEERVGPLGSMQVPPPWFLSLNGFVDVFIAVLLRMVYGQATAFYTKLLLSFLFLGLACGLVAVAAVLWPNGGISPLVPAISIILVSFGELHHMPILMAAISNEMPKRFLGVLMGVYFMIYGIGGFIGSVGAPLYKQVGPEAYFGGLAITAAVGMACFALSLPFLRRTFPTRSSAEGDLQQRLAPGVDALACSN